MINALATWHQIIENKDVQQLDNLLADEAVLHSPIVHVPMVRPLKAINLIHQKMGELLKTL